MKIQYCSDLHLERFTNKVWIEDNPIIPIGEVLIVAGDTHYLGENYKTLDFFKFASDNFRQTYVIPGNHEFYNGYDVSICEGKINEDLLSNVKLIHNDVVYENNLKLVFSTMWSKIENHPREIINGITDFKRIKYRGKRFGVYNFNEVHKTCFDFIEKETAGDGKKIVVTHHLPSSFCNAPEHKDSIYNDAFCVDKTEFVSKSNIDYWIYGHNHRMLPAFELNGTKLVSNQLGYVDFFEHKLFVRDKIISI